MNKQNNTNTRYHEMEALVKFTIQWNYPLLINLSRSIYDTDHVGDFKLIIRYPIAMWHVVSVLGIPEKFLSQWRAYAIYFLNSSNRKRNFCASKDKQAHERAELLFSDLVPQTIYDAPTKILCRLNFLFYSR